VECNLTLYYKTVLNVGFHPNRLNMSEFKPAGHGRTLVLVLSSLKELTSRFRQVCQPLIQPISSLKIMMIKMFQLQWSLSVLLPIKELGQLDINT
jgi:hypothetical protein